MYVTKYQYQICIKMYQENNFKWQKTKRQGNFCQKEYNIEINLSNISNKIPIPNMYQNIETVSNGREQRCKKHVKIRSSALFCPKNQHRIFQHILAYVLRRQPKNQHNWWKLEKQQERAPHAPRFLLYQCYIRHFWLIR